MIQIPINDGRRAEGGVDGENVRNVMVMWMLAKPLTELLLLSEMMPTTAWNSLCRKYYVRNSTDGAGPFVAVRSNMDCLKGWMNGHK